MRRRPVETDFNISITENFVEVRFAPTRSLYTFTRLTSERDVAEFGPLSPGPVERHLTRSGVRGHNAGEVRAMAFRLATTAARAPDVRDASAARAPNPSAGSMEHLILAALEARSGGDLVYRRNHKSGKLFCLALGIHDMHTVARELAERSSHINARWMRRFYRAWRALCDSGGSKRLASSPSRKRFRPVNGVSTILATVPTSTAVGIGSMSDSRAGQHRHRRQPQFAANVASI
jgi:hypothetical protein